MATVLEWRPRKPSPRNNRLSAAPFRIAGAYAGRARFKPHNFDRLPDELQNAIGRIAEFGFAGIAPNGEPFAGQELYLEWCSDEIFGGFAIPEQDLQFLNDPFDVTT